ncbi:MAG TPA: carboxypeptidase-like regulatory domain-containing protein [Candidatus Saccharibacteria bacterium]|nr:carboxypeptidase-like regulatory domain-containing protein [Candidatus Saccharibacteria bacterium]
MDFLDPKKKRSNIIKLYIGYGLMAILIGVAAVVLLYAAFGYGVNRDGEVYQNSTVFLASQPDGANVDIINSDTGTKESTTTNDRLILPQGNYSVTYQKQGYRPWTKSVEFQGGQLTRLDYPFLFAKTLSTSDVASYSLKPGLISVSPDRSKQLVQRPDSFTRYDLLDNADPSKPAVFLELPSRVFPGLVKSSKLVAVEWSTNNRHLLTRYNSSAGLKYVLIDTENPQESVNINTLYDKKFIDVRLRDKSPENLYMLSAGGNLQTGNLKNVSAQKILSNVAKFQPYKNDKVLFVNNVNKSKQGFVKVQLWDGADLTVTIKELPRSDTYFLDLAEYDDNLYVAIGASSGKDEAYIFRNPLSSAKNIGDPSFFARTLRLKNIQQLSFSLNARFVSIQSGSNFNIYDAEDDRQYKYGLDFKYENVTKHQWMDNHRLVVNATGEFVVFEFDGTNANELFKGLSGSLISFDSDYQTARGLVSVKGKKAPYIIRSFNLRAE